jgi:hypothetical protein
MLRHWVHSSIFPGPDYRDYKGVLGIPTSVDPQLGLGVMVADHTVAAETIRRSFDTGLDSVVAKGLFSARREAVMAISNKRRTPSSYHRLSQLARLRHGCEGGVLYRQPLILQPAFTPPSLENLGIEFSRRDAATITEHGQRISLPGESSAFKYLPEPASEHRYFGMFRLFFVYLPTPDHNHIEPVFAGGLLQATCTPMSIHGSNGTLTVWVDGHDAKS